MPNTDVTKSASIPLGKAVYEPVKLTIRKSEQEEDMQVTALMSDNGDSLSIVVLEQKGLELPDEYPDDVPDEKRHNCDFLGCRQEHVMLRIEITN